MLDIALINRVEEVEVVPRKQNKSPWPSENNWKWTENRFPWPDLSSAINININILSLVWEMSGKMAETASSTASFLGGAETADIYLLLHN